MKKIIILCLFLAFNINADSDIERANLAKVIQEMDFLITKVDEIKHFDQSDQKLKFNYEALKKDLSVINDGIKNHVNRSLKLGRLIEKVDGQYTDHYQHVNN